MRLLLSIHGIQCKKNIHFSKELIVRFLCDKIESVWKILLKRTGDFSSGSCYVDFTQSSTPSLSL